VNTAHVEERGRGVRYAVYAQIWEAGGGWVALSTQERDTEEEARADLLDAEQELGPWVTLRVFDSRAASTLGRTPRDEGDGVITPPLKVAFVSR